MGFTRLTYQSLFLVLFNTLLVRSQEPAICVGELNSQTWQERGMKDQMLNYVGIGEQNMIWDIGYQSFLINSVQGAVSDSYRCDNTSKCDLTLLNENCPVKPEEVTILKAIANWNNYWQDAIENIVKALDFVSGEANNLRRIFNPTSIVSDPLKEDQTIFGGITTQIMTAMLITSYPPIVAARQAGLIPRDFTDFNQKVILEVDRAALSSERRAGYDKFASIENSISALSRTIVHGLRVYIEDQLNNHIIFDPEGMKSNLIFQLQEGDFATPIPFPTSSDQIISAAFAPAINRIWNDHRVAVVKITQLNRDGDQIFGDLLGDESPCDVGRLYSEDSFCDDVNRLLIRQIPAEIETLAVPFTPDTEENDAFRVLGLDDLPNFKLPTAEDLVRLIIQNQVTHGFSAPPVDAFDLLEVVPQDLMFFNIPFCSFDTVTVPGPLASDKCGETGVNNFGKCITHLYLLCGCPQQDGWPYQTGTALGGRAIAAEFPESVKFTVCDVTKWNDQLALFKDATSLSPSGKVDVVVANAGIGAGDTIGASDLSKEDPDEPKLKTLSVNLTGALYTVRLALHYFRRQNEEDKTLDQVLILGGSMAGYLDTAGALEYGVSKYALRSLMTNLRLTEWRYNIRVAFIGPWFVATNILPSNIVEYLKSRGAQFATVEDCAKAVTRIIVDKNVNGRTFAILPRTLAPQGYLDVDCDDFPEGHILGKLQAEYDRSISAN